MTGWKNKPVSKIKINFFLTITHTHTYTSPRVNISFEGKTLEVFPIKSEIRQEYSILPQLVNKLSEVLANAIKRSS